MKRFIWMPVLGLVVLVTVLFVIVAGRNTSANSLPVPADRWGGLETREYRDDLEPMYASMHETGSPDPEHVEGWDAPVDPSRVIFRTKETQYSLRSEEAVTLEISYLPVNDTSSESDSILVNRVINLERWDMSEWKRMITAQYIYDINRERYLNSGETVEAEIVLDDVITVLTPGKYRAVAYINNEPVYTEFELVE